MIAVARRPLAILAAAAAIVLLLVPPPVAAESDAPTDGGTDTPTAGRNAGTLAELLEQVREGSRREEAENLRREQEFRDAAADQKRLLEQALTAEARQQA